VVTGAASGIGLALSERFGREGMRVVLADIDEEQLANAEQKVKQTGAATLTVHTDVSRAQEVQALADATIEAFGAVHVVCNNAGVFPQPSAVWEQTQQDWEWMLGVNVWGVINGLRTFVPILLQQNTEGHVVNTASMAGHVVLPFLSPYHATKFAVVAISECLYHELAASKSKLHVSVLCPGFTRTGLIESERNRPSSLQSSSNVRSQQALNFRSGFRELLAGGFDPSIVAEGVVNAIRDERFYVFTHPHEMPAIQARVERLLAAENPELALPDDMRGSLGLS
jgi:NAD(P)-dependent dehydrogenase (short-subunit alcohol dehydrogenase family)